MEAIVRIKEVMPLEVIEYQNRTTLQTDVMKKKCFLVRQGDQEFLVEASGKLAESCEANALLKAGEICYISCRIYTRQFLKTDNTRGFSTDIQLRSISPM